MDELDKMVQEIANKLTAGRWQLNLSASYYESTFRPQTIGISTPQEMQVLAANIGWPRMYLDSIEERLDVESFRLASNHQQVDRLLEWWQANQLDEESGLAHLDALIYGRSYVTVSAPGPNDPAGIPIIRVESPLHMYAEVDPRTRLVTRALRLYTNPENKTEQWATLYLPDKTVPLVHFGGRWIIDTSLPIDNHNLGVVPVVPILNRERLSDRDGRSEITPELRSFTDAASRTMMNMQAAAELMAVPQRVLFGVDAESLAPNGTRNEVLTAYMAQILAIENDAGKAMQFNAAELRNFTEVLQELAKHVASYTGLPPQYLSFSSENPASAEAIRSSESRLVKKCERKSRMFGGSWEQVMRLAVLIIDGTVPTELQRLETIWADPATPTFAAKADAVAKLYGSPGQGIIPKRRAREDMGYTEEEILLMEAQDDAEKDELKLITALQTAAATTGTTPGRSPGAADRDRAA